MLRKHSEKQLYNEGHGPNPALSLTQRLCKEMSSRLQLPSTLQDLVLIVALRAAAEGWRWEKSCKMLFFRSWEMLCMLGVSKPEPSSHLRA